MLYLSRDDIEKIAERVVSQYKKAYVPEYHMCYMVDATELAEMLEFKIEYVHITKDGSILGQTSCGRIWTTIFDDDMNQLFYELDGSTILVDKRLLSNPKVAGRKNFTIAHEIAHQIINRQYPEMYDKQNRIFCDYRRSVKPKKIEKDWHEWQADALAAALLLPMDALQDSMFMFGLGDKMKMLSRKYSDTRYKFFCDMAEYLQVSRTALSYRMEQLGLLGNNRLIIEAEARRKGGVNMPTEKDNNPKIAVRCENCKKILAFKLGAASGFLQLKCPACKTEIQVDLSLRRGRIYNRKANIPLTITFL